MRKSRWKQHVTQICSLDFTFMLDSVIICYLISHNSSLCFRKLPPNVTRKPIRSSSVTSLKQFLWSHDKSFCMITVFSLREKTFIIQNESRVYCKCLRFDLVVLMDRRFKYHQVSSALLAFLR